MASHSGLDSNALGQGDILILLIISNKPSITELYSIFNAIITVIAAYSHF